MTGEARIDGGLTAGWGTALVADGASASFVALGASAIDGANLYARNGGAIHLPGLATYTGGNGNNDLQATGSGSVLDLSGLTTLTGTSNGGYRTRIDATDGGRVDLSGVATAARHLYLTSSGVGSVIDLANATTLDGSATSNGVTDPVRLWVASGGEINTPNVEILKTVGLYAYDGSTLAFPLATTYAGQVNARTYLVAQGQGSTIDLPAVTDFAGANGDWNGMVYAYVQAIDGGRVDLSSVTTFTRHVSFLANAGTVDLSAAVTLDGSTTHNGASNPIRLEVDRGGSIPTPNVTTLQSVGLYAYDGSTLDFPLVTSYSGQTNVRAYLVAEGQSSTIDLSALTDFAGANGDWNGMVYAYVQAIDGGRVDLSSVTTFTRHVSFLANAGTVDLSAAVTLDGSTTHNGASNPIRLEVDRGGSIPTPNVTTLQSVGLYAYDGSTLDFPLVTSYSGQTNVRAYLVAEGQSSTIDLSALTDFAGANGDWNGMVYAYVQAIDGGRVDLSSVTTFTRHVSFLANAGTVDLSAAVTLDGSTTHNGASNPIRLEVDRGGSIPTPNVTTLQSVGLYAYDGSTLAFPLVTSYSGQTYIRTYLVAQGQSSTIDLSAVTDFVGSYSDWGGIAYAYVQAIDGGLVDLSSATTFTRQISFLANAGTVDLTAAVTLDGSTTYNGASNPIRLEVDRGGSIPTPNVTTLQSVGLYAYDGSTLAFPLVTSYSGQTYVRAYLVAQGQSSTIDLSAVTDFVGSYSDWGGIAYAYVQAIDGGLVDLSSATTFTRQISFLANAGTVDLTAAVTLDGSTTYNGASNPIRLEVDRGGSIPTPNVTTLQSVGLYAYDGSTLAFPLVTSYSGQTYVRTYLVAQGQSSTIDLSAVTDFVGSYSDWGGIAYTYVQAIDGGRVDLSSATTFTRQISFLANAGTIDLSAATSLDGSTTYNGASDPIRLQVSRGGSIPTPNVTALHAVSLYADSSSRLAFPNALSYEGRSSIHTTIQADGAGSEIALPAVTSFRGNVGNWGGTDYAQVTARDGGQVDLSSLTTIGDQTSFLADRGRIAFSDGIVSLSGLSNLTDDFGAITAGTIQLTTGANVTASGRLTASLVNGGQLRVGSGPAELEVTGDYTQADNGSLWMDLSGWVPGLNYDRLTVGGRLDLDGTLNVATGSFRPDFGNEFTLLRFATRGCDFVTKTGLDLGGGLFLAARYETDHMALDAGDVPDSGRQCLIEPEFTDVRIGPDPAKVNDPLSITFDVSEPLVANPAVTVDGHPAAFVSVAGSLYTYSYLVTGAETEGTVDVVISGENLSGGIGTTTDSVTLDFTPPTLGSLAIIPAQVDVGQALSVSFRASEPLSTNTIVKIGGLDASLYSVSGLDYIYRRTITGGEGAGPVDVEVVALDLAGNSATVSGTAEVYSGGLAVDAASIQFSTASPRVGDLVTATAVVRNTGVFDLENVPVAFRLLGPGGIVRPLGAQTIATIPAGGSASLLASFDVQTTGVQVFEVLADPDDLILEDSETDNVARRSLVVGDPVSSIILVSASLSESSVLPGRVLTLDGTAVYNPAVGPSGNLAVAGGSVFVTIPGAGGVVATTTDANGHFAVSLAAPTAAGSYSVDVRASDGTAEGVAVLPLTVNNPPEGVDLYLRPEFIGFSDASPLVNASVTINARIYNVGGLDQSGPVEVQFYDGATLLGTATLTDLAAGASKTVSLDHAFATPGSHAVTVVVDPADAVTELVESNNTASLRADGPRQRARLRARGHRLLR